MSVSYTFSPQGRFADWRLATQSIIGFWSFYLVTVLLRGLFGPEGAASLSAYRLQLFRPVQPMLADSEPTVAEAMEHSS